jgi:hypothetical protein
MSEWRRKANRDDPGYKIWKAMRQRCLNPNATDYARYGGRGITVCERWERFENFLADMGSRPSMRHTLDRINSDGNYEPGNYRWITWEIQQSNKKVGVTQIEVAGMIVTVSEAVRAGAVRMNVNTVRSRILRGWSPSQALATPVRRNSRWHKETVNDR